VFRSRPDPEKFYERCGFPKEAKVIIAASTHKGEEEICLNAFLKLKATYPRLRLIIAPRHIQRAAIIGALVKEKSLALRVADEAGADLKNTDVQADVFVLNTIGQLASLYEQCDYVFMGGSLIRHGGQNPLEAVIFGKPIITGPHIFNFQEVYHDLVKCGGAYIVKSETEFDVKLAELVADEDKTISMGQAALDLLKSKRGATKRNCDMIENVLKSVAK
jgi:3-deoxy-D-manno-octulosonic-acid transferase